MRVSSQVSISFCLSEMSWCRIRVCSLHHSEHNSAPECTIVLQPQWFKLRIQGHPQETSTMQQHYWATRLFCIAEEHGTRCNQKSPQLSKPKTCRLWLRQNGINKCRVSPGIGGLRSGHCFHEVVRSNCGTTWRGSGKANSYVSTGAGHAFRNGWNASTPVICKRCVHSGGGCALNALNSWSRASVWNCCCCLSCCRLLRANRIASTNGAKARWAALACSSPTSWESLAWSAARGSWTLLCTLDFFFTLCASVSQRPNVLNLCMSASDNCAYSSANSLKVGAACCTSWAIGGYLSRETTPGRDSDNKLLVCERHIVMNNSCIKSGDLVQDSAKHW